MGNYFLLQGTFPTQGSNRSLPHWGQSHLGRGRVSKRLPLPTLHKSPLPPTSETHTWLPDPTFFPIIHLSSQLPIPTPATDCVWGEGEWVQLQTCHQSEYHSSRHQAISSHTHISASPPPTPHTSVTRDKIGKRQLGTRHAFTLSLTV